MLHITGHSVCAGGNPGRGFPSGEDRRVESGDSPDDSLSPLDKCECAGRSCPITQAAGTQTGWGGGRRAAELAVPVPTVAF